MIKFTDEQSLAINARNCGIIVSAAAGSGKTAVLVERLVRIISDETNKVPADRIVVVTFTKDAAAQMKQRLITALTQRLEDEPENMWLSKQQSNIQSTKICTIHSFCFDMIRENAQLIGLSPDFRISDENEEKLICSEAVSEVIEELYKSCPDDMKKMTEFFCSRGDRQLEAVINKIYKYLLSIPFYLSWLDKLVMSFNDKINDESNVLETYSSIIGEEFSRLKADADVAVKLSEMIGATAAASLIAEERDAFAKIAGGLSDGSKSWEEKYELFRAPVFGRISFPKFEKESYEDEVRNCIKDIRDTYKKRVGKLFGESLFSAKDMDDDRIVHKEIMRIIGTAIHSLDEKIRAKKLEKNAIGFSDAEQLACALLAAENDGKLEKTPLALQLSEYYKEILVDEYQDVNNIQSLIFKLLSRNESDLFVVGDVKQSIYRFRLANPEIFVDTLDGAVEYKEGNTDFSSIILNKNFRSSEEVVELVNFIFTRIMSRKVGETPYTDKEKLDYGADFLDRGSATEVILVDSDEQGDDDDECVDDEARAVARKIKSMLSEGTVVHERDGAVRPCRPRDFCVLVRKKKSGELLSKELERFGVRASTDEVEGYLRSREMSVLFNLLRVVDNPLLEIPLASVLMSPMFMLDAEEMARLRLCCPSDNLYRAVLAAKASDAESYSPKIKKFCETLDKLRSYAAGYSLEQLIRMIYNSTDYLSVIQLYRDGNQKRANLRLLIDYARTYEENRHGGLSGFLRYIGSVEENGGDFRKAGVVSASDDAVSVKTIHKSKGLEYPFVFLCMTSTKFNQTDLNSQIQLDTDSGIGFKIQDKKQLKRYASVYWYNIREVNRRYLVSEELRLLYVALTRAKEQLFITLDVNKTFDKKLYKTACDIMAGGGVTEALASGVSCMSDWLAMCLLVHPDAAALRNRVLIDISDYIGETSSRIRIVEDNGSSPDEEKAEKKTAVADDDDVRRIAENTSITYDNALSRIPAKLSVTEIVKSGSEITLRKPAFMTESKISGAARGTATHLFMQYCNFENAEKSVTDERDRLREAGMLGVKESSAIQIDRLEGFFSSELYCRIKNAEVVERERKFLVKIDELDIDGETGEMYSGTNGMLQGVADCIFGDGDTLTLIDYKTDRAKSADELKESYGMQLELYRAALNVIYGGKVKEALIYSFELGVTVKIC